MCGCRSKCVSGTDNLLTSSGILFRVSSFVFNSCNVLLLSDTFSKREIIPMRSPRSEFIVSLVASRSEDALNDLTANSILGAMTLSIAFKIAISILSSTVSTMLPTSLSILSLKHLFKVFTLNKPSLAVKLLPVLLTVNSWSTVPSLTTTFSCLPLLASSKIMSWLKSYNWLRSLLFDCLFLRVETGFAFTDQMFLNW